MAAHVYVADANTKESLGEFESLCEPKLRYIGEGSITYK